MFTLSVFIEQAEKNGDDGEPKTAAAVSRLRLFDRNSIEDLNVPLFCNINTSDV